ncbi:hypothetical protein Bca4012_044588 [Brassica carinata]
MNDNSQVTDYRSIMINNESSRKSIQMVLHNSKEGLGSANEVQKNDDSEGSADSGMLVVHQEITQILG